LQVATRTGPGGSPFARDVRIDDCVTGTVTRASQSAESSRAPINLTRSDVTHSILSFERKGPFLNLPKYA